MTRTQKVLRGMLTFDNAKPKVQRRLKKRPGYRNKFDEKQARNLAAARLRVIARREAARTAANG